MATKYKITIEKTEDVVETGHKSWEIIDYDMSAIDGPSGKPKPIMGYTPPTEKTVTRTTEIYSQTVDSLDVFEVIYAVNKKENR